MVLIWMLLNCCCLVNHEHHKIHPFFIGNRPNEIPTEELFQQMKASHMHRERISIRNQILSAPFSGWPSSTFMQNNHIEMASFSFPSLIFIYFLLFFLIIWNEKNGKKARTIANFYLSLHFFVVVKKCWRYHKLL